jgi:hypothetical protein
MYKADSGPNCLVAPTGVLEDSFSRAAAGESLACAQGKCEEYKQPAR